MAFSKTFPKQIEGSNYPRWEEVFLTEQEELEQEQLAKTENIELMKKCIDDAKAILAEKGLKHYQSDVVNMAISMFEKRASHTVFWKESKCKEKFDNSK
ncbi:hypothetical protein KY339_01670 [Candidatus Woesearchaeota archaeon]|jgi:hypothetical protein|nr:hypothetical protein [Candidatus Woesearchaeota archaeon]